MIAAERKAAGLTKAEVAKVLRCSQSIVTNIESGQRRIDVVEFLDITEAIGFDTMLALKALKVPARG